MPAPTNDNFADAELLAGSSFTHNATSVDASVEVDEPNLGLSITKSVWFRWTPPASGRVTLTKTGSFSGSILRIYTGNALNALTLERNYNGGSIFVGTQQFYANFGVNYYFYVGGQNGTSGDIVLNLTLTASSLNMNRYLVTTTANELVSENGIVVDSEDKYYVMIVGPSTKFLRSSDRGKTWSDLTSPSISSNDQNVPIAIDSNDVIYALYKKSDNNIYYKTRNPLNDTWSSENLISQVGGSSNYYKFVNVDQNDDVYFTYQKENGSVTDLVYRKLSGGVLGAEVNVTNLTVSGAETNRVIRIFTVISKYGDIYIFYIKSFWDSFSPPSQHTETKLLVIKNFNTPSQIAIIPIDGTVNEGTIAEIWFAIADNDDAVHLVYHFRNNGVVPSANTNYYARSPLFTPEELPSGVQAFEFSGIAVNMIIHKNLAGELRLIIIDKNGSNYDVFQCEHDGVSWQQPTAIYTNVNSSLAGRVLNSKSNLIPIVSGNRNNYHSIGFSFFEAPS